MKNLAKKIKDKPIDIVKIKKEISKGVQKTLCFSKKSS